MIKIGKNKKKILKLTTLGFTLMELLAVIVILAVISLITIPLIGNIIEDSKKKALEQGVYGIVEAANYFVLENTGEHHFIFDENNNVQSTTGKFLSYKGQVDVEGELYIDTDGNISLCLMNESYYVYKNYNSGIYIGDVKEDACIIDYDALTNKYVAMLDDGTGTVSNVYSKSEVDSLVTNLQSQIDTNESNINTVTSITNTNKTNIESNTKAISDLQTNLDLLNNNLTPVLSGTSGPIMGVNSVKIGKFGIVSGRKSISTNSSGIKEINITLPYKFKSGTVSLNDNAFNMHYVDTTSSSAVGVANILYSGFDHGDENATMIKGHIDFGTGGSYQIYSFTVIGELEE